MSTGLIRGMLDDRVRRRPRGCRVSASTRRPRPACGEYAVLKAIGMREPRAVRADLAPGLPDGRSAGLRSRWPCVGAARQSASPLLEPSVIVAVTAGRRSQAGASPPLIALLAALRSRAPGGASRPGQRLQEMTMNAGDDATGTRGPVDCASASARGRGGRGGARRRPALAAGEIVLIMGPSGSGKTTLLSMLGALLRPSEGEHPPRRRRDHRAHRARAARATRRADRLHLPGLQPDAVAHRARERRGGAQRRGRPRRRGTRARDTLLDELGLGDRLDFLPEKLSGGEKQRVAIARALANEPDLVLADEPTANLDSSIGREVMRRLREIAKRRGQSVLIVSHDDRIREFVDRVLWLEDGEFKSERAARARPGLRHGGRSRRAPAPRTVGRGRLLVLRQGCRKEFESRSGRRTGATRTIQLVMP